MKAQHDEAQHWQNERRKRQQPITRESTAERRTVLLKECENVNSSAWWRLTLAMMPEETNQYHDSLIESDITQMPGFKTADEETRARIINAAKAYILEHDPGALEWLGTNSIYHPAFAGYRALILLSKECQKFFSTMSSIHWCTWCPIILAYPLSSIDENYPAHRVLRLY